MQILTHFELRKNILRSKALVKRKELNADGRRHCLSLSCGRERAGLLVDAKGYDRVGELVLGEQVVAGGIDREVPRFFAAGWDIRLEAQQTAGLDLEDGDRVTAAV